MQSDDLSITDGAAAGTWIRPRLGGEFGAVTLQVPEGFEAYARIFHPARDPSQNPVRWAQVAKDCGTTPHREMQWHAIIGFADANELRVFNDPNDPSGSKWSGWDPLTGTMDLDDLDSLCEILATHTADPTHCFFGLCTIECWGESFASDELKKNPLRLPWDRDHIVLAGPLSAVDQIENDGTDNPGPARARSTSVSRTPSSGEESRASALDSIELCKRRDAPNLIWPNDCSWLVASEVDFDSTLVGGGAQLIEAIVDSPKLEAWQVEPTDSLAADADKVNAMST
jgi:hypothetical protein